MQTSTPTASPPARLLVILLCALSMSVTWRIRGQTGHEFGAALAGALGALALVTLSGRPDWWRRAPSFALFGALGWAFGGSMSYMKVVGYCHSSDSATVLYGFAGMFLIGFLWAGLGGGGTALPAVLASEQLSSLYPAVAWVFGTWFVSGLFVSVIQYKTGVSLEWLDSDWLPAATAIAGALLCWAVRRRFDLGVSLVLHLAAGWWVGILVLVAGLGLHLNPPRGDNWGGIVGVFAGFIVFCLRHRLREVVTASVSTGLLGAFGFCLGQMLKLSFLASGVSLRGNKSGGWHSVMEWSHGLFFGAALAAAMLPLILRGPRLEWRRERRWPHGFAVFFLLWVLPYLNLRTAPRAWTKTLGLPDYPAGLVLVSNFLASRGFVGWLELVFLVYGLFLAWQLRAAVLERTAYLPKNDLGRAQLLFVFFTWSAILISFIKVVMELEPFILVVQSVITIHAIACMALMLYASSGDRVRMPAAAETGYRFGGLRMATAGFLLLLVAVFGGWIVKRALYGNHAAGGFYMDHIRFGPDNTNTIK